MTKFFLLDLILFLIIGGVAIILQYHFGNRLSKKVEIVYGCISVVIVAVTSTVFAIKMNPIITPSLHADYLKLGLTSNLVTLLQFFFLSLMRTTIRSSNPLTE